MTSCDPGDHTKSYKVLNVQALFSHYVTVNIPIFLTGKNQLPAKSLVKDRKIASKRILIERTIGLATTYLLSCHQT